MDVETVSVILLRLFAVVIDVKNILVCTRMNHLICVVYAPRTTKSWTDITMRHSMKCVMTLRVHVVIAPTASFIALKI